MINFILVLIAILLSPAIIVCAFISAVLIACIIYTIAVGIAECVRRLIDNIKGNK